MTAGTPCKPIDIAHCRKPNRVARPGEEFVVNEPITFSETKHWPAGTYYFRRNPSTQSGLPCITTVNVREHRDRMLQIGMTLADVDATADLKRAEKPTKAQATSAEASASASKDLTSDSMQDLLEKLADAKQDDVISAATEHCGNQVFLEALLAAEIARPNVGRKTRPAVVDTLNALIG